MNDDYRKLLTESLSLCESATRALIKRERERIATPKITTHVQAKALHS